MTRRKYESRGRTPKPLGSKQQPEETCEGLARPHADEPASRITSRQPPADEIAELRRVNTLLRQGLQELEERLQERTVELEASQDQLRALTGELTLTEQRERRRLAEVLHDHLQQLLVGARFRVLMLTGTDDPKLRQAAEEVEELLRESILETRSLTTELSPPLLRGQGLPAGLKWLAKWMQDRHHLSVDLMVEPHLSPMAEDLAALLFESVRELLFNVVKHSQVRSAQVSMCRTRDSELQIAVSDRGVGFDAASVSPPGVSGGGFGLFSISERLSFMGGRLEIESSPGRGTRVKLLTPLVTPAPQVMARTR
jgi:signal transduction histidine kinase